MNNENKKVLKPQKPIAIGDSYVYPVTAADQVIRSNGSKLEIDGIVDADRLNGLAANNFVTKEESNNNFPFSFGIDENGNYGYYKDDELIPFAMESKYGYIGAKFSTSPYSTKISVSDSKYKKCILFISLGYTYTETISATGTPVNSGLEIDRYNGTYSGVYDYRGIVYEITLNGNLGDITVSISHSPSSANKNIFMSWFFA